MKPPPVRRFRGAYPHLLRSIELLPEYQKFVRGTLDFGASKGSPASGKDLIHASDVKMYFKDGVVHSTSRYLDKPIQRRLFTPQTANKQPTLFD